jgi:hypothetical protein
VARTLVVWRLQISDRVADKIESKHGISAAQVREAVVGVGRLPFRWDHHPDRGHRALVVTAIDDQPVLVVLYPAKTGHAQEWWLGSAYPLGP